MLKVRDKHTPSLPLIIPSFCLGLASNILHNNILYSSMFIPLSPKQRTRHLHGALLRPVVCDPAINLLHRKAGMHAAIDVRRKCGHRRRAYSCNKRAISVYSCNKRAISVYLCNIAFTCAILRVLVHAILRLLVQYCVYLCNTDAASIPSVAHSCLCNKRGHRCAPRRRGATGWRGPL
jgi:hypothetical protein